MRDFLWLEMQRYFRDDAPSMAKADRMLAEDLVGELTSVRYALDSAGRIKVEDKSEIKKRLGRSPDLADSLALTFSPKARNAGPLEFYKREFNKAEAAVAAATKAGADPIPTEI